MFYLYIFLIHMRAMLISNKAETAPQERISETTPANVCILLIFIFQDMFFSFKLFIYFTIHHNLQILMFSFCDV